MINGMEMTIGIEDRPGTMLVTGNVLFGAGVRVGPSQSSPSWFFEFDGTAFHRTTDPPNYVDLVFATRLLMLPNGDAMFCRQDDASFYAYHSDSAVPQDSWRPVIQSCPSSLQPGTTVQISGLQFNGLSQVNGYGDDFMNATNYPLVERGEQSDQPRAVLPDARSYDGGWEWKHGNFDGVATGNAVITTNLDIPGDIDAGDSMLYVVANGIPSQGFPVTVQPVIIF
jgi:hypothetical protein